MEVWWGYSKDSTGILKHGYRVSLRRLLREETRNNFRIRWKLLFRLGVGPWLSRKSHMAMTQLLKTRGELWRLPGLSHVPGVRSSRAGQDVAESKRCNQWSQASICSWRNWKPKWLNWMWKWNRTGKPCFSMLQQHAQIQQRLSEMSSMWPQERYGSGWNANHSWSNVETEAGNGSAWNRSWAREAL